MQASTCNTELKLHSIKAQNANTTTKLRSYSI